MNPILSVISFLTVAFVTTQMEATLQRTTARPSPPGRKEVSAIRQHLKVGTRRRLPRAIRRLLLSKVFGRSARNTVTTAISMMALKSCGPGQI